MANANVVFRNISHISRQHFVYRETRPRFSATQMIQTSATGSAAGPSVATAKAPATMTRISVLMAKPRNQTRPPAIVILLLIWQTSFSTSANLRSVSSWPLVTLADMKYRIKRIAGETTIVADHRIHNNLFNLKVLFRGCSGASDPSVSASNSS